MIFDYIFPNACLVCRSIDIDNQAYFCHDCWKNLTYIQKPYCDHCGLPFAFSEHSKTYNKILCNNCTDEKPFYTNARCVFVYNDTIKKSILTFKNQDQTQYAKFFSKILFNYLKNEKLEFDIIVPIPLHWTRLIKRQFNQSALIAFHLAKLTNTEVNYHSLKRIKKTSPQIKKSRLERILNLKDSFIVDGKESFLDKKILVIDDVMTTGSTLNEAAKSLKNAQADKIYCLSLARSAPGFI